MLELDSKKIFRAVLIAAVILACFSGYPNGGASLAEQLVTGKIAFKRILIPLQNFFRFYALNTKLPILCN